MAKKPTKAEMQRVVKSMSIAPKKNKLRVKKSKTKNA